MTQLYAEFGSRTNLAQPIVSWNWTGRFNECSASTDQLVNYRVSPPRHPSLDAYLVQARSRRSQKPNRQITNCPNAKIVKYGQEPRYLSENSPSAQTNDYWASVFGGSEIQTAATCTVVINYDDVDTDWSNLCNETLTWVHFTTLTNAKSSAANVLSLLCDDERVIATKPRSVVAMAQAAVWRFLGVHDVSASTKNEDTRFIDDLYSAATDEDAAMRLIYGRFFELRRKRRFDQCDYILDNIVETRLSPVLLVATLTATAPIRERKSRLEFFRRAQDAIVKNRGADAASRILLGLE